MLRIFAVIVSFAVASSYIRTYSTVWTNDRGKVVKKINYAKRARFEHSQPNEDFEIRKLPYGWVYASHLSSTGIMTFVPVIPLNETDKS
jgi:hypothetical protein